MNEVEAYRESKDVSKTSLYREAKLKFLSSKDAYEKSRDASTSIVNIPFYIQTDLLHACYKLKEAIKEAGDKDNLGSYVDAYLIILRDNIKAIEEKVQAFKVREAEWFGLPLYSSDGKPLNGKAFKLYIGRLLKVIAIVAVTLGAFVWIKL